MGCSYLANPCDQDDGRAIESGRYPRCRRNVPLGLEQIFRGLAGSVSSRPSTGLGRRCVHLSVRQSGGTERDKKRNGA
jgi:hypothetical protein